MTAVCPPKALENEWEGKHTGEFSALVPAEHTLNEILDDRYFGRFADALRVNDRVTVVSEDASLFAILVVRHTDKELGQVRMRALMSKEWSSKGDFAPNYSADYRGEQGKWVLTYDGKDVESGFDSEESAAIRSLALDKARQPEAKPTKRPAKAKTKAPETEDA